MDDLISRTWLLAEYDKRHNGPPGGARKLIEEAPSALGTNLAEVGTDAISRQAAITAIQNAYCDTDGGEDKCAVWKNVGLTEALHIMQDLPSAQPEQRWIPCSAGLPKTNDPVNVTYVNHNPGNYYAEVKDKPYTATAHFHNGQWYWYSCTTQDLLDEYGTWIPDLIDKDVEILAWMPMPESFKG